MTVRIWRSATALLIALCASMLALQTAEASSASACTDDLPEVPVIRSFFVGHSTAGYFLAEDKGFYCEEGINVTHTPGGGRTSPIQLVAMGRFMIGHESGIDGIIAARTRGIKVRAVGAVDRVTPFYIMTWRTDIKSPKDLEHKTVAVSMNRPAGTAWRALLAAEGVDVDTITEVPNPPSRQNFWSREADAAVVFLDHIPAYRMVVGQYGMELSVLRLSDYSILNYGHTIFTTEEVLAKYPEIIEKYIRATERGWKYVREHPEEGIDSVIKRAPDLASKRQASLAKLQEKLSVMVFPEHVTDPFGVMSPDVWQAVQGYLLALGRIDTSLPLDEFYTNEFALRAAEER